LQTPKGNNKRQEMPTHITSYIQISNFGKAEELRAIGSCCNFCWLSTLRKFLNGSKTGCFWMEADDDETEVVFALDEYCRHSRSSVSAVGRRKHIKIGDERTLGGCSGRLVTSHGIIEFLDCVYSPLASEYNQY
jgi:hypothetical protein